MFSWLAFSLRTRLCLLWLKYLGCNILREVHVLEPQPDFSHLGTRRNWVRVMDMAGIRWALLSLCKLGASRSTALATPNEIHDCWARLPAHLSFLWTSTGSSEAPKEEDEALHNSVCAYSLVLKASVQKGASPSWPGTPTNSFCLPQ